MSSVTSRIDFCGQKNQKSWFILIGLGCMLGFAAMAQAHAQEAKASDKQTEFAGAKLGTKVSSLGIKLDDYRSVYKFKERYFLSAYISESGHPIFMIELRCHLSNGKDQQSGIKCNDPVEKITSTFGSDVEAFCTVDEAYQWEEQFEPVYYYVKKTNQFFYVNGKTQRVDGFGIALPDVAWRRCIRKFSASEIAQIKLGMNAQQAFGDNFISPGLQQASMVQGATVQYESSDPNYSIKRISFDCGAPDFDRFPKIESRLDCGLSPKDLQKKYGNKINARCAKSDAHLTGFYRTETKEFWSINYFTKKVDHFGYDETAPFETCEDLPQIALGRLREEAESRKSGSPPVPLKTSTKIVRIKGISLGEPAPACSEITSETFSIERKIINICKLKDGDNTTLVYFDAKKQHVVKIVRNVYVNEIDSFINDALEFYGKEIFQRKKEIDYDYSRAEVYEYGDTEKTRGLKIAISKCIIRYDGRTMNVCVDDAKYLVTLLMVDVGAFKEAENDGRSAFKKREF